MSPASDTKQLTWETSDLGTAAYVHMRSQRDKTLCMKLLGSRKTPRGSQGGGKFVFLFADPHDNGRELQVEYLNSDCRGFDAAVRSLKKLCYDSEPSSRRRS